MSPERSTDYPTYSGGPDKGGSGDGAYGGAPVEYAAAETTAAQPASMAARDIAERTARIERMMTEPDADTGVIVHDLNQLDIAVAASGDAEAATKAKELRERVEKQFPV